MSRSLKAALCAASAMMLSSTADAAYVQYDFYTTGAGQFAYGAVRDQVFSFIVGETSGSAMTSFPTPSTFLSNTVGDASYYGRTQTSFATTTGGLTGSADFGDGRSPTFAGSINAAASFNNASGAQFTFQAFDVSSVTGAVSLQQQGSGSGGAYSGSVVRVVARVFNGSSPRVGFIGFASAVPEPSTWALMLAGFGMVGYSLRRRSVKVAYAS